MPVRKKKAKARKTPKKKAVKSVVKKTKKAVKKKAAAKRAVKKAAKKTAKKKAAKKTSPKPAAPAAPRMPAAVQQRRAQLTKILLKKRNEVVQGLETRMGRKLEFDASQKVDSAMDTADQSSQDVDAVIDYSILEMKYEQYKDIADAFRKLQNSSYGLCEECGGDISIKRLEVNPLARYCIECKTRKEELERIQKEETRFKE